MDRHLFWGAAEYGCRGCSARASLAQLEEQDGSQATWRQATWMELLSTRCIMILGCASFAPRARGGGCWARHKLDSGFYISTGIQLSSITVLSLMIRVGCQLGTKNGPDSEVQVPSNRSRPGPGKPEIMRVVKPGRGNSLVRVHHCTNSLSLQAGDPEGRYGSPQDWMISHRTILIGSRAQPELCIWAHVRRHSNVTLKGQLNCLFTKMLCMVCLYYAFPDR